MTEGLRSAVIWTAVFLAFELPAHYGLVPWYTLSRTVWVGEAWYAPLAVFTAVFMFILLGHFELHWSAKWVIVAAVVGGMLVVSHLIEKAVA